MGDELIKDIFFVILILRNHPWEFIQVGSIRMIRIRRRILRNEIRNFFLGTMKMLHHGNVILHCDLTQSLTPI